jgi:hypothetical protein
MSDRPGHAVKRFWERLDRFDGYPAGVAVRVPSRVKGTAFFAASSGLWGQEPGGPPPAFPYGGVMVVGNNLDNEERYAERLAEGRQYGSAETGTPTWRELLGLSKRVGVAPDQCFFTNIWVGLKAGGGSNTGAMAVEPGSPFDRWCQRFLCEPGQRGAPAGDRSPGSARAGVPLSRDRRSVCVDDVDELPDLDRRDAAVHAGVRLCGHTTSVVALLHPSYRRRWVAGRRYGGLTGDAAEVAMLLAAVAPGCWA